MSGVPVAREGVPNQASADRAFQLDLLAGSLNFQKHSGFFSRKGYFLSAGRKAVQGTLGITGPLPSSSRIFADCISALTPTTSKAPSCCVERTWSPLFGTITLDSVATFASSRSSFVFRSSPGLVSIRLALAS